MVIKHGQEVRMDNSTSISSKNLQFSFKKMKLLENSINFKL